MLWLKTSIVLFSVGGAHLQCFTPDAHIPPLGESADLKGVADFGFDLYGRLTLEKSTENFFFSPYSIWAALVMVYFGAAGNTQAQLEAALRLSDKASAHRLAKGLEILYKQQSSANLTLDVANRAYFNQSFALLPCVHTVFPDELRVLNFYDAKNAAGAMNSFVSQATRGLINNIVDESQIREASMVLINAVYFKGFWKNEFKKSLTKKEDFFVSPTESVAVDMMSQTNSFKYGESAQLGARVLELPYAASNLSMLLLLPNSAGNGEPSLADLVRKLSSTALQDAISPRNMRSQRVHVRLPKFIFRAGLSNDLKQALQNLGIRDVFTRQSDLSQFSSQDRLLVTDIIHKAYVDVNEEGTEAAAVTAVIGFTITSVGGAPRIIDFYCDRPFVFIIYDRQTDNVLFVGDIKNPSKFQGQ
ncbi:leukocyte elastase inhibitor-like [Palaemon carinicauda]|uniref:leukocyte elastase inhibitor-like n=1 Tax=Palaemon carinicauda TaxID=392227 RepID=UPI0035B57C80